MKRVAIDRKSCGRYLFTGLVAAVCLAAVQACSSEAANTDQEFTTAPEEAAPLEDGALEGSELGTLEQALRVCTPGQRICQNSRPRRCRADGSGFDALPVCTGNAFNGCEGSGSLVTFFTLLCDDGNACTRDACQAPGGCSNTLLPSGTACPGGICSAAGQCVVGACRTSADCVNPAAVCAAQRCVVIR